MSLLDLVRTPEGTVVQVHLVLVLMVTVCTGGETGGGCCWIW